MQMLECIDMEKIRAVTASHPNWIWSVVALAALPLFMALDIEGVYVSVLFGLRVYAAFNLRPVHYPVVALLELALVAANPFNRLLPDFGAFNPETLAVHAAGIAATYVCAWLLRADIDRIGSRIERAPLALGTVLAALSAGTGAAVVLAEYLSAGGEPSYLVSAAFARLNVYVTTALLFGIYAVFARARPRVIPGRAAAPSSWRCCRSRFWR